MTMPSLAERSFAMSLRSFCRRYAKQFDDGGAAELADWLLAACLNRYLEPYRICLSSGGSTFGKQQELAPEQLADVLRYMGNSHWLQLPNGALAPLAERKDPRERWLDVLGENLFVSCELALQFAQFHELPPPVWWAKGQASAVVPHPTIRPHSFDKGDETLLLEMRDALAADPNLTIWDAAGQAADRAPGSGSFDSKRRRLKRKFQARI